MSNTYNTTSNTSYPSGIKEIKLTQEHEQTIIAANNEHELKILETNHKQEISKLKITCGWLGGFFGGKELTALNISGALLILLILFGVGLSITSACVESVTIDIKDIWAVITPIITLTLGYIFGNKTS